MSQLPDIIDLTNDKDTDQPTESSKKMKAIGNFIRQKAANIGIPNDKPFYVEQLAASAALENTSVILCNKDTLLYNSRFNDRGWACGYRNCQMLLSSLMSMDQGMSRFGQIPGNGNVPSIAELQQMLELAWQEGYDRDGAAQLNYRVVGTHKWIGATEAYCILAHLGIRSQIVDFHHPTMADGTHPALFEWIAEYYTNGEIENLASNTAPNVRFTNRHPLYLQHQGHSRTVVGVELGDSGTNILLFDPDIAIAHSEDSPAKLKLFRLQLGATRRADQYQVLYPLPVDQAEIPKLISSLRIP
ncbi:hypothetical protein LPJ55_004235 [Coemansia sp. RSA 990]|nr:hypothetical protein LPJ55_004235 [Coemansia sp. RSA 990]